MSTEKIIRLVYYVLVVVLLFIGLYQVFGIDKVEDPMQVKMKAVSASLIMGIIFACIAAGIWLIVSLIGVVTDFKRSLFAIIGAAVLVAIFFISYSAFSDATWLREFEEIELTARTSKAVEAGLITSFVLSAIALVVWIADGVKTLTS